MSLTCSASEPNVPRRAIHRILKELSIEIRELDVGYTVDRVPELSAIEFLRDYVGPNKPVVLTDSIFHWPALELWSDDEYLLKAVGDEQVTVALTPNGRADAVTPLPACFRQATVPHTAATTTHVACSAPSTFPAPAALQDEHGAHASSAHQAQQGCCFALPAQRQLTFRQFLELLYASNEATPGASSAATAGAALVTAGAALAELGSLKKHGAGQLAEQPFLAHSPIPHRRDQVPPPPQQQHKESEAGGEEAGSSWCAPGAWTPRADAPPLVPYLQFQNSSLVCELPRLLDDVDRDIPWATEAFGAPPEAVNIWVGDGRSTTSWHKDPYENLYAVISGEKTFTLLPPSDVFRMRLRRYPLATYQPASQGGHGTNPAVLCTAPLNNSDPKDPGAPPGRAQPLATPQHTAAGCLQGESSQQPAGSSADRQPPGQVGASGGGSNAGSCSQQGPPSAAAAPAATAAAGAPVVQSLLSERLVPVLHSPRQHVLWSSHQPGSTLLLPACGGSCSYCEGGGSSATALACRAAASGEGRTSSCCHQGCSASAGGSSAGSKSPTMGLGDSTGGERLCCGGRLCSNSCLKLSCCSGSSGSSCSGTPIEGGEEKGGAAEFECCTGDSAACQWAGLPRPLRVTVRPGELLYLPALWWHQVEQREDDNGRVIAVNYWYDMKFDAKYATFLAVEKLSALLELASREGQ